MRSAIENDRPKQINDRLSSAENVFKECSFKHYLSIVYLMRAKI